MCVCVCVLCACLHVINHWACRWGIPLSLWRIWPVRRQTYRPTCTRLLSPATEHQCRLAGTKYILLGDRWQILMLSHVVTMDPLGYPGTTGNPWEGLVVYPWDPTLRLLMFIGNHGNFHGFTWGIFMKEISHWNPNRLVVHLLTFKRGISPVQHDYEARWYDFSTSSYWKSLFTTKKDTTIIR